MKTLKITKAAASEWERLAAKQYRQIGRTIIGLLKNPEPHDSSLLRGAKNGERRVDIGEYRIIYSYSATEVEVLVIGKRNDGSVYKEWARK